MLNLNWRVAPGAPGAAPGAGWTGFNKMLGVRVYRGREPDKVK